MYWKKIYIIPFEKCNIDFLYLKVDYGNNSDKIIISEYFAASGKPLKYGFNKPINDYYYKFWEYFYLTPFFKENPFKYINILSANRTRIALYKIIDKIVWFIPFRKTRYKLRKSMIKDIDNIMKHE